MGTEVSLFYFLIFLIFFTAVTTYREIAYPAMSWFQGRDIAYPAMFWFQDRDIAYPAMSWFQNRDISYPEMSRFQEFSCSGNRT